MQLEEEGAIQVLQAVDHSAREPIVAAVRELEDNSKHNRDVHFLEGQSS